MREYPLTPYGEAPEPVELPDWAKKPEPPAYRAGSVYLDADDTVTTIRSHQGGVVRTAFPGLQSVKDQRGEIVDEQARRRAEEKRNLEAIARRQRARRDAVPAALPRSCKVDVEYSGFYIGRHYCRTHGVRWEPPEEHPPARHYPRTYAELELLQALERGARRRFWRRVRWGLFWASTPLAYGITTIIVSLNN